MRAFILCLFINMVCYGQVNDTIYGSVKSVRSKLIFNDSLIQNEKLFANENEYGHHGFTSNEFTEYRFKNWWYNTHFVHYINFYKEYNQKNLLIKEEWFYKNGDKLATYNYLYNKYDKIVQEKYYYSNPENFYLKQYGYNYNNKLVSIIETHVNFKDPSFSYERFIYDSNDHLIKHQRLHDEAGMSATINEYGNNNLITTRIKYSEQKWVDNKNGSYTLEDFPSGTTFKSQEFYYDDKDQVIKRVDYSERDTSNNVKPLNVYSFEYKNSKVVKEYNKWNDLVFVREYEFDKNDMKTVEIRSVISNDKQSIQTKTLYEYDNNNQLVKLIYSEDGQTFQVDYIVTYDVIGNWVKQDKLINGEKLFTWIREITYWE